MTTEEIAEAKKIINEALRSVCQKYLGHPITDWTIDNLTGEVRWMLRHLSDTTGIEVIAELEPDVRVEQINGLTVLFNSTTPRSEKFLLGEEF